jgi:cell division protein FtsB
MRRDSRKTWALRGMGAALVALALALTFGYLPYRLYSRSGFSRYLELSTELRNIERENARLRTDNARLAREAAALRTDPRLLEREARTRLQWVKPGEVLFDLGWDPERVPDPPRRKSGGEAAELSTRLEERK